MAVCLLGNYEILHACQERFAFLQIHAQHFHRQFLPLDRQDLPPLFVAVGVYAHDLDADIHDHNLRPCTNSLKRVLASCRLNRSGCRGPSSCSLRSMLWKPSPNAVRRRSHVSAG